jgi:hypothetical protein
VSPRFAIRRIGAVFLAAAVVAGCSSAPSADDSTSTKITTDLAAVGVTGKAGTKPVIDAHAPFSATETKWVASVAARPAPDTPDLASITASAISPARANGASARIAAVG